MLLPGLFREELSRRAAEGTDMVLVDRSAEHELLSGLVARAAEGLSGTLVLRGEPGVGKTALLDDMAATATSRGMRTARLAGVEPETHLGYAALHRFLLLFPNQLERLPGPQRQALRSTFGLVAGPPADRFLVALGAVTLLGDVASQAPLLCLVDDAQWIDPESAVALGFVARRLHAERVVLVFADRAPSHQPSALSGIPELPIGGLGGRAAVLDHVGKAERCRRHPHRRRDERESAGPGRAGERAVTRAARGFRRPARTAPGRRHDAQEVQPSAEPHAAPSPAAGGHRRRRTDRPAGPVVAGRRAARRRSRGGRAGREGP